MANDPTGFKYPYKGEQISFVPDSNDPTGFKYPYKGEQIFGTQSSTPAVTNTGNFFFFFQ